MICTDLTSVETLNSMVGFEKSLDAKDVLPDASFQSDNLLRFPHLEMKLVYTGPQIVL